MTFSRRTCPLSALGIAVLAVGTLLCTLPAAAYDRAMAGYEYEFPRDHFDHPNFQVEWWYYTGNLQTDEGRRFGFELTFFRLGMEEEPQGKPIQTTAWDLDNLYLAHFALSDIESEKFYKAERLNRAGPGLAGAELDQARIWNGNWQVQWAEPLALGRQKLRAVFEDASVELELAAVKPAVIHGSEGVSRKAEGPGRASHYISFTRLTAEGSISLDGRRLAVSGLAWMDHEFSTDSMGADQAGWDWMSIQLDNNTELMLYRMRRTDGSADPLSSGTFVDAQGNARHLKWGDIVMEPGAAWESPHTGGRYPTRWKLKVRSLEIELECRATFPDQEVVSERDLSPTYWEGAVTYEGQADGEAVSGVGYLEMTGYDEPIRLGAREAR